MATLHRDRLDSLPLPTDVIRLLTLLAEDLVPLLSEDLVALCIFGSTARGEWFRGSSDINLLIVLSGVDFAKLARIRKPLGLARKDPRVVPLIITEQEIAGAADVFCIKFSDIQRHHVCIAGQSPLTKLEVNREQVRFVAEYELRNAAQGMRRHFVQMFGHRKIEQKLMMRYFSSTLFSLRALVGLVGEPAPSDTAATIMRIGEVLGMNPSVLEELNQLRRGQKRLAPEEIGRMYSEFNALLVCAVERVDALEGSV